VRVAVSITETEFADLVGHIDLCARGGDRNAVRLITDPDQGSHDVGFGIDHGDTVTVIVGYIDPLAVRTDLEIARFIPHRDRF